MEKLKVEGHTGLYRDAQTGAIVNSDREGLLAARKRRDAILAEKQKLIDLEDKVARLENLVTQLLGAQDGE